MSGPMTEPREALAASEPTTDEQRAYNRGWQDGNASALDACNPIIADLQSRLAAGVHLGDEGLREAAQEVLAATGDRPPEGPEPTTAEVERWYIANDSRIIRALAALALAAQENPAPARSAPSLDEGLLALALYEVDGFGLLSECRETARDIASVYRRLAQEGETP